MLSDWITGMDVYVVPRTETIMETLEENIRKAPQGFGMYRTF